MWTKYELKKNAISKVIIKYVLGLDNVKMKSTI